MANISQLTQLVISVLLLASTSVIAQPNKTNVPQIDPATWGEQHQAIDTLLKQAETAFKSPIRASNASYTGKLQTNMEIVSERLLAAYELAPYRADLLFSAASARISNKDVEGAIELYNKILDIAPDDVDAHTYLAVWSRFKGDSNNEQIHMMALQMLDVHRYQQISQLFSTVDSVTVLPIETKLDRDNLNAIGNKKSAIVTFGYMLNDDGSMHDILVKRLEKTLEVAKQLPNAMIIVTGGVPKSGSTEALLMSRWLVEKGVDSSRIVMENSARTTVENALYSRYILAQHRIGHAVVISSGSHVRRALALLKISVQETGPRHIIFYPVAALDKSQDALQKVTDSDKLGFYRDGLRTMGIWSFRSYPLEER